MDRKDIANSQDYKATKAALKWWYSLPEEQRKATDIDAEPDIIDAYADGVIYGWNNPQWIPVEERLPEENTAPLVRMDLSDKYGREAILYDVVVFDQNGFHISYKVTHWMPIVPPRKEEKE